MKKSRVSFFVHDLAGNPVVRAAQLAAALQPEWDVELIGFLFSGDDVYEPYRDLLPCKTLPCRRDLTAVARALPRLAAMAEGKAIYACKPLLTSLGPALLASGFGRRRPLLLDAEDDEWVPFGASWPEFIRRDVLKGWRHATAWKYTRLLHPFTRCAHAVTVASRRLQSRYGGTIVLTGPDETIFDPDRADLADPRAIRARFGLPVARRLALFAGVPQPHKGLADLLAALLRPGATAWDLVLAGPPDHPQMQAADAALGSRCHRVGLVPNGLMPALIAACDLVPVPQRRLVFAESQVPAKALEAMAMAKPVLATRVGDLPVIVGEQVRGWLSEPDDPTGLAACLEEADARPEEAVRRGRAGRRWCLDEASRRVTRIRLRRVLAGIDGGGRARVTAGAGWADSMEERPCVDSPILR